MYTSVRSALSGSSSVYQSMTEAERSRSTMTPEPVTPDSNPVQIATITGRQEVKLKTKQNDTLHGPKVMI